MRTILLALFALFICSFAYAQSNFHPGSYYNLSGQKITGFIDFCPSCDRIFFKATKDGHKEKIKIGDISAVAVNFGGLTGIDSLSVLTEDNNDNKRYFAKFYFATPVTKFYYKSYAGSYGGAGFKTINTSLNTTATIGTYTPVRSYSGQTLMYQEGNTTYELTKGNYIDVLSKACADLPDLAQKIKDKEFKFKQVDEIINWYINKTSYKTSAQ